MRELGPAAEHAGAAAPRIAARRPQLPFKGYVIFFRYLDDAILEIVHIIEGHRDVAAIFAREDGGQN